MGTTSKGTERQRGGSPDMSHPAPSREGHYWAKLRNPTRMPAGEDWASSDWEVVQVFVNDFMGDETDPEYFGVSVPGVSPCQWVSDFEWGPRVEDYHGE